MTTKTTSSLKVSYVKSTGKKLNFSEMWQSAQATNLNEAIIEKYVPYVFGADYKKSAALIFAISQIPPSRICELAVAKYFKVDLPEPGKNTVGYDLDSEDKTYGKIEVRTRTFISTTSWRNDVPYVYDKVTVLSTREFGNHGSKIGLFDWVFSCCWDPNKKLLVWFRIPHTEIKNLNSVTVSIGKDGNYGKWDKFLWVGPC